jgi:hypothetical protein
MIELLQAPPSRSSKAGPMGTYRAPGLPLRREAACEQRSACAAFFLCARALLAVAPRIVLGRPRSATWLPRGSAVE